MKKNTIIFTYSLIIMQYHQSGLAFVQNISLDAVRKQIANMDDPAKTMQSLMLENDQLKNDVQIATTEFAQQKLQFQRIFLEKEEHEKALIVEGEQQKKLLNNYKKKHEEWNKKEATLTTNFSEEKRRADNAEQALRTAQEHNKKLVQENKKIATLHEALTIAQNNLKDIETNLNRKLVQEQQQATETTNRLHMRLKTQKEDLEKKIIELHTHLTNEEQRAVKAEQQLAIAQQGLAKLQENSKQETTKLLQELEDTREQLYASQEHVTVLKKEVHEFELENQDLLTTRRKLLQELTLADAIKVELAEVRRQYAQLKQENTTVKDTLAQTQIDLAAAHKEQKQQRLSIASLQKNNTLLKNSYEQVESKLAQATSTIAQLESTKQELTKLQNQLLAECKQKNKETEKREKHYLALELAYEKTHAALEQANVKLAGLETAKRDLINVETQLSATRKECEQKNNLLQELKHNYSSLEQAYKQNNIALEQASLKLAQLKAIKHQTSSDHEQATRVDEKKNGNRVSPDQLANQHREPEVSTTLDTIAK